MILRDLCNLYDRLLEEGSVAPAGWGVEEVGYRLVIDREGHLLAAISYASDAAANKKGGVRMVVPEQVVRTSGVKPYFLCDNGKYLLGLGEKKGMDYFKASGELHRKVLKECNCLEARAILAYFERPPQLEKLTPEICEDIESKRAVFAIASMGALAHECSAIREIWEKYRAAEAEDSKGIKIQCSVTGKSDNPAKLFPQVSGFPGAQSSGASLVSFNQESFESYGKAKTQNASISEEASFKAGSAMKYIARDNNHRIQLGNTMLLFWTDRPAVREDSLLSTLLDSSFSKVTMAEDKECLDTIANIANQMRKGSSWQDYDLDTHYHLMGIAPNAARLSVRFYHVKAFGDLAQHCKAYLDDTAMDGVFGLSLSEMLRQTAAQGENDNIPSTMNSGVFSALIAGEAFPQSLYSAVLSRMRADHGEYKGSFNVPGKRAAILKACLVRSHRKRGIQTEEELTMSLNTQNRNPGYVMGRLFALLERVQEASSQGKINATVRDKYIGGASTSPARVFPQLMANAQNHLSKLSKDKPGYAVKLQKMIDEVFDLLDGFSGFPKTLSLEEQGMFFVAYHQQRYALYQKQPDESHDTDSSDAIEGE